MNIDFTCNTDGKGLWSTTVSSVLCTELKLDVNQDNDYGELMVAFDLETWNPEDDGLIYTDDTFIAQLKAELMKLGFSQEAVDALRYSEQGMQGDSYVSFDADEAFVREFEAYLR